MTGGPEAGLTPKAELMPAAAMGGHFPSPIHDICLLSLSQQEQAKKLWFMSSRGMVSYSGKNIPAGISCILLYQHRADKGSQCWQAQPGAWASSSHKSGEAPPSPPVGAESPECVLGVLAVGFGSGLSCLGGGCEFSSFPNNV